MKNIFNYLIQTFLYGGLTKEEYNRTKREIIQDNQKTLIKISAISIIGFVLALVTNPPSSATPLMVYIIGSAILVLLIILVSLFKKNKYIIGFGIYFYITVLYMAGIYISAVSGIRNLASTFMVFLIVIPLIFIIRPIIMSIVNILADLSFVAVLIMRHQDSRLLSSNKHNAIIYGFVSIVIGTMMLRIKFALRNRLWEVQHLSETDQLTELWNRRSYEEELQKIDNSKIKNYTIVEFDINGLKRTNDTLGHDAGDELIKGAADCIKSCFGEYGKVFRTGGDEFISIMTKDANIKALISNLENKASNWNSKNIKNISLSTGYAEQKDSPDSSIYDLIKIADSRMYESKAAYYKQHSIDRRR